MKWLEGKKREKKELPISWFRTHHVPHKQIFLLEASEGTEGIKATVKLFIFYSKSLPVCSWGHFSHCPHSLEEHRTIVEQEEIAGTRRELAVFSLPTLGRETILVNEHFLQESCGMKSGAWLGKLSQTLDNPSYRSSNPFSSGHSRRVTIMLPRNRVFRKNALEKAVFGIRLQALALRVLRLLTTAAEF